MALKNPNFCVMPWYSHEVLSPGMGRHRGQATPCCLLPEIYNRQAFEQAMREGKKPPECEKCWTMESLGVQSRRQQENAFLDYKLDRDIELIEQDVEQGRNKKLVYQIMTSNLCNLACVTCNGAYSTKWIAMERRMHIHRHRPYQADLDQLGIDWATARRLTLQGGEPLIDPSTEQALSRLLDYDNTDCSISFVTNGSVTLSPSLLAMMQEFQDLNICISIDGLESVFEYLRWPLSWDVLQRNLEQYRRATPLLSVSYTISALNALYYDDTLAWFASQGLRHNHNVVYYPQWTGFASAPVALKQALANHEFFGPMVEITGQELTAEKFAARMEAQDYVKKTNWRQSLPELAAVLGL